MKPKQPHIYDCIKKEDLILPDANAHVGLSVPNIIFTYGDRSKKVFEMPYILTLIVTCFIQSKDIR